MRNRFVIGAVSDHQEGSAIYAATNITGAASQTGGTKDAVVVAHDHSITDPGHYHEIGGADYGSGYNNPYHTNYNAYTIRTRTAYTGITGTNTTGESGLNKNLPPYYALAFIMRIS